MKQFYLQQIKLSEKEKESLIDGTMHIKYLEIPLKAIIRYPIPLTMKHSFEMELSTLYICRFGDYAKAITNQSGLLSLMGGFERDELLKLPIGGVICGYVNGNLI